MYNFCKVEDRFPDLMPKRSSISKQDEPVFDEVSALLEVEGSEDTTDSEGVIECNILEDTGTEGSNQCLSNQNKRQIR